MRSNSPRFTSILGAVLLLGVPAITRAADLSRVVIDLDADIDKVEGKITAVGNNRRGLRLIVFDQNTGFELSLAEDLKTGRDVFVIGLKLSTGKLRANRVVVYEGKRPVRMKGGCIIRTDGTADGSSCSSHRLDQPGPGDSPR